MNEMTEQGIVKQIEVIKLKLEQSQGIEKLLIENKELNPLLITWAKLKFDIM